MTEEEQVDDRAKGQKEGDKREEEQETGEKEGGEEKAKVNAKGGEAVEEEERTISYNYDQMKSKPEVVNVTDGNLLELQYPLHTPIMQWTTLSKGTGKNSCPFKCCWP